MKRLSLSTIQMRVVAAFLLLSLLLAARESSQFGFLFGYLPVLGGSIPYFLCTICLILIYRSTGRKLAELGLKNPIRKPHKRRAFVLLLVWVIGIILASLITGSIVVEVFNMIEGYYVEVTPRKSVLAGNLPLLLLLTPLMWLAVLGEELLFRGFIMNFVAGKLGNSHLGWLFAIVLTAIVFGAAHFWQGARGMVGAGMLGFIWGLAYYFSGKNLWPATLAHCVTNTIGFISTYQS